MWRGDSRRGATSPHKESREAEKTSTPPLPRHRVKLAFFSFSQRASRSCRQASAGTLSQNCMSSSWRVFRVPPGGACGGEWVAQVSSRGWRSESARALVLRGKRRVEDGSTTEDLKA